MSPNRYVSIALTAVVAIALAGIGCSKDGDSKAGGKAPSKTAFAVFPKDATVVFGVNIPEIKKSKLFSMFEEQFKQQAGGELKKLEDACGLDPFEVIEQVIVGGNTDSDKGYFVVKGLTKDVLTKCAESMAKSEGEKIEITHDGKVTKIVSDDGDTAHLVWLDDKTFLAADDKVSREELLARSGGKDGLDKNEEMMAMLGNVDAGATVWGFGHPPKGAAMGPDFQAAYGSISLKGGLKVDIGLRLASADEAKKSVDEIKGQLGMAQMFSFGKYVSKIKLEAKGADMIAQLKLSNSELEDLIKLIQSDPMMQMVMQKQRGGGGSPFGMPE